MSTLSELFPAGGGDNTIDMVASGTLSSGDKIVLNSDGTVSAVSGSTLIENIPSGSETVYNSGDTYYQGVAFDPNTAGKFVVIYRDIGNSSYGTAVVGTVSGASISFGSEYVFRSSGSNYNSIAFDPHNANKFVVAYGDDSGYAIIGTVSGSSLSFGSAYTWKSGNAVWNSIAYDQVTANTVVAVTRDGTSSYAGTAVAGTVSGTVITFGSAAIFNSGQSDSTVVAFDPFNGGKFAVTYRDSANSGYGTACVGTVSGTTITFGSEYVYQSASVEGTYLSFDSGNANTFVNVYNRGGGRARLGTISGTAITYGAEATFDTGSGEYASVEFDPSSAGKFIVMYRAGSPYYGKVAVGTVSGTSISFGSSITCNAGTITWTSISFDPSNAGKFVVVYRDEGNSNYGTAIIGQMAAESTNLTSTNLLGVSQESASDGGTASIDTLGGVSDKLTGLTIGSDYYVATDGTLTTTVASNVSIGKAVNSTTINMRDYL